MLINPLAVIEQALVKDLCTYYHTVNYSLRRKLFFPFRFVYD
jgi:hypothetical protein